MPPPEGLQRRFQTEIDKFKAIEKDKEKSIRSRQQLEAQLTENNLVKEELDRLEADATVYKLIGPVLVKQDLEEAKSNVGKRIEFISNEVKRQEATMEELNQKQEAQKESLTKLQAMAQQAQVKAAIKS